MNARLAENFLFAVNVESVRLQDRARRDFTLHDRGAIIGPFEQRGEALAVGIYVDVPGFEMAAQARHLMCAFDDHQRAALSALDFTEFRRERLEARRSPHATALIGAQFQTGLPSYFHRPGPSPPPPRHPDPPPPFHP